MEQPQSFTVIHSSFLARIKEFILSKTAVAIYFYADSWEQKKIITQITGIQEVNNIAFLVLKNGADIELSALISVDLDRPKIDKCGIDRNANPCGDASDY